MTPSVLVTGATGFLGRHLLATIREVVPGLTPIALVRDRRTFADAAHTPALEGRLEDVDRWGRDPLLAECRGIVHCAALVRHSREDAAALHRANVAGTQEMVRLAARLGCRLIALSTSGTIACSRDPAAAPDESAPYASAVRDWPYYASKIAAERAARALAGVLDVELVIVRPPVLLGPGDDIGRSTSVVRRMLAPRPIVVDGGYHFADVRDVARAALHALMHSRPQAVYNLPGWNGTLRAFAHAVGEAAGREVRPRLVPSRAAHAAARLLHPLGRFVDPVLVEMARHHWNFRSRWSHRDLAYHPRDPRGTLRDTLRSLGVEVRAA